MARDHIRSRALFKSEVWTGKQESMELGEAGASWPCSLNMDLESSEWVSGGESGLLTTGGGRFDSGLADDAVLSGSSATSSIVAESPEGSKLPSLDPVVCS